ncbi:MAG: TetR family transcriptional regulator [Actinocrinis sp.]
MAAEPLTRDRVLDAAEDALRRFGPAKTTVVDVARALGVSHGTVYRHFASKAELLDAVLERWLSRMNPALSAVVEADAPAAERLHRWLTTLMGLKQEKARVDADLFAAYSQVSADTREVIVKHVGALTAQLARIIADGMARGEFEHGDPTAIAYAVFEATAVFHHPAHAAQWSDPVGAPAFEPLWDLLLRGLAKH